MDYICISKLDPHHGTEIITMRSIECIERSGEVKTFKKNEVENNVTAGEKRKTYKMQGKIRNLLESTPLTGSLLVYIQIFFCIKHNRFLLTII